MGPKKEKKEKKSDGDAGGDGSGALSPENQIKMLTSANHALQMQLADRQEQAVKALAAKRELQSRVRELETDFESERNGTMEITQDMTRQYKGMQEELLNRVNTLENSITSLRDELDASRVLLEDTKRQKDQVIANKDAEITEMKIKMDEMAQEFGEMLKDTLEKMRERIEVSNSSFDKDTSGVPMIRRLEDFNLGGTTTN